jgi:hypothetical protein
MFRVVVVVVVAALALAVVAARPRYSYVPDALPPRAFRALLAAADAVRLAPEASPQSPQAFGRLVGRLPAAAAGLLPPGAQLAEVRVYPAGAGMGWHRDLVLADPPQTEHVLTLRNSSDSVTCFDRWPFRRVCVATAPNSLLSVRAGGVRHAVAPGTRGSRTIVKFYTPTGNRV